MFMRNFSSFNEAKEIYTERVLYHIHYRKLGKRIKDEIENHMDDMYDDFKNDFNDELDVAKKVIDEMGDPDELGLELKKANRKTLRIVRAFKVTLVLSIIPALIFCQTVLYDPIMEIESYFKAVDLTTIEARMSEQYNNGKPITLFAETDHNGKIYRYYVPDKQPEGRFVCFHTESITVLGKSCKDKFLTYGCSSGSYSYVHEFKLDYYSPDYLLVLTAPAEARYYKIYLKPFSSDSNLEPHWTDFMEYPQNGTYDNPVSVLVDLPEGYNWRNKDEFDENMKLIE